MEYPIIASSHILALVFLLALYIAAKSIYHVVFSPLAGFPGPRLAATTKLYEAYHMIIKDDWLDTLERLHRQYGRSLSSFPCVVGED